MFSTIKMYIIAGVSGLIAILLAVLKMRNNEITNLEKDIVVKDKEAQTTAEVVKEEKKAANFTADNRVAKAVAEGDMDEENTDKYDPTSKFYV